MIFLLSTSISPQVKAEKNIVDEMPPAEEIYAGEEGKVEPMGQEEYDQLIDSLPEGAVLASYTDVLPDVIRDKEHDPQAPDFETSK
ncbi:hypothetical protein GQR36_23105 [Enterococcus termitis]